MSKAYREISGLDHVGITTDSMREFCQRPGKMDDDGNPIYFTEQAHASQCDVNNIIRKYDRTGLILHINKFEAKFGDLTGVDFRDAQNLIIDATNSFNGLPADIRKRFSNDPANLLKFMESPDNREEAISLGLISSNTPAELDGLGEHITGSSPASVEASVKPDEPGSSEK